MPQKIFDVFNGDVAELDIPDESSMLMPGVAWGNAGALFTPAFWKAQMWYAKNRDENAYLDYSNRTLLHDEVAACLLGGHGITAEMARAAFVLLKARGALEAGVLRRKAVIQRLLKIPLHIEGSTAPASYRFPNVKARYLSAAMEKVHSQHAPEKAVDFRQWLLTFEGIGWKTASWITRNWKHSNEVAIVDIHVFRAGAIAGIFPWDETSISARYRHLEERFLAFSAALGEEPRRLDVLVWRTMKDSHRLGVRIFGHSRSSLQYAA